MKNMDCLAHAAQPAAGSRWSLFDLVGSGVAVTATDGTFEYCNSALLRLLAQNAQTLCGTSIFTLLDGGANGALESLHRAALAADRELRTQVRSPGGRFVAGAVLRRLDSDDGQRVIWSFVDARFNEPVPELALWGTEIGLWDWDVVNDRLTWINNWCEHSQLAAFSGYGHEQLWSSRIHPEDLPAYREALTRHLDGQSPPYDVEYRLRNRDDAWVWIQERGRVIERDPAGRASRAVGICLDADERRKSARALERSEARLEAAIWGADLGLWDWKLEDDSLLWLSDWPARYGVGAGIRAVRRDEWIDRVHPLDRQKYAAEDHALIHDGRNSAESDYRIQSSSGEWRWVNVRTRVVERNATGQALRIVGACIDVDSRRRAEQLLRTQAMILETMREGVVLVNPTGRIEFTNPAFDRMFGRKSEEPAGISVLELLELHGRAGTRDMLFRRPDGSQFAGEVLSAEIELSGEKRILVVVQDVSQRKQLESEIIEIANRERRRLGADLHDGLGQELTGISLMLRSLSKRAANAAFDASPELNEIIALVNHAIQSSRRMALGISPVTLERGGLLPALQTLIAWSRDSYNIDVRLRVSMRSPLIIGESAAAHLYLIVQEAINNAVRHGRARSIAVTLRTNRVLVSLSITDDGVGIAEITARGAGMGLKLMQYRSAMIGGVMRIKRLPQGGTRIHSVCPQDFAAAGFPQDHDAQHREPA
jgi:PAS domain S-box-containing protein